MNPQPIRVVDRELLLAMRGGGIMGIGDLTTLLGVTATAIRQRVDRLLAAGLIERHKEVAGRGRPTYRYTLSIAGHQSVGANPGELADAMWREILAIEDDQIREQVVSAVASRLGRQYAGKLAAFGQDDLQSLSELTFAERMKRLAVVLSGEEIDSDVRFAGESQLPVLDIASCPYPSLSEASEDRAMCRLEEKMLSEALGQPVALSSCRLDGDDCCQFKAADKNRSNR